MLKKTLAVIAVLFLCVSMAHATSPYMTTLTGTMNNPDGSPFSGTLYFSLSSSTTISNVTLTNGYTCPGPIYVPNTNQIPVQIQSGAIVGTAQLYDSLCTQPAGLAYNVLLVSVTGQRISQQWVVTGLTENIGTIVPVTQSGTPFQVPVVNQIICGSNMSGCGAGTGTITLSSSGGGGSSITWLGAWSGSTAYVANNAVSYQGSSYVALLSSANVLPTNTTDWALIAQAGSTGQTGATGSTGATGPNSVTTSTTSNMSGLLGANGSTVIQGTVSQVTTLLPAFTGDVNSLGGTANLTLPIVNSNVGTCGDATHVGQATFNAKGLTTACTPVSITSGSPAGSNGNPQINASGSFGAAANVFYQQSGDTIASIESMCSSLCTYVVTSPQTITLVANHTLSANVFVQFDANGVWTVNGSGFTLSGIQISGGTTTSTHFSLSGTGSVTLSAYNSQVPVEWFGAVGGATLPSTDSTTAIQACFDDIYAGQCIGQSLIYKTSAVLQIDRSNVGFGGTLAGRGGTYTAIPTVGTTIITTSATADIIDAFGSGASTADHIVGPYFTNFSLGRSTAPTGTTDAGLSLNYVGGYVIRDVSSQDSHRMFYFHSAPSYDNGGIWDESCANSLGETTGTWSCNYLDSADGNGEASIIFHGGSAGNFVSTETSYLFNIIGTAVNDVNVDGARGGVITGVLHLVYTGTSTNGASDLHFSHMVADGYFGTAFYVSGLTATGGCSLTIDEAWAGTYQSGATAAADIENSCGVHITNSQLNAETFDTASYAVEANNSSGLILSNNNSQQASNSFYYLNNTNNSTVTGNTMAAPSGSSLIQDIDIAGTSAGDTINSNTIGGYATTWSIFTATSTSRLAVVGNTTDPTHMPATPYGVNGSENVQFNSSANVFHSSVDNSSDTGTTFPAYRAIGAANFSGWNAVSVTRAWELGFVVPGGTVGSNPIFSYYNGTSWAEAWHINSSTGAMVVDNALSAPTFAATTSVTTPALIPGTIYSAAGTALPTCAVGIKGEQAVVSDATTPTYMGAYTSGGGITAAAICSYNGSTYSWLTH